MKTVSLMTKNDDLYSAKTFWSYSGGCWSLTPGVPPSRPKRWGMGNPRPLDNSLHTQEGHLNLKKRHLGNSTSKLATSSCKSRALTASTDS